MENRNLEGFFSCNICPYYTQNIGHYNSHILKDHPHMSRCSYRCPVCNATYNNYSSLRSHKSRKNHNGGEDREVQAMIDAERINEEAAIENVPLVENIDIFNEQEGRPSKQIFIEASYLLKLKESFKLSDRQISEVLCATKDLISCYQKNLEGADVKIPFQGIETAYKQEAFLKKHLNYVPPVPVHMGERLVTRAKKGITRTEKRNVLGFCVPFEKSLEALVTMPEVECLFGNTRDATIENSNDVMKDIWDGTDYKEFKNLSHKYLLFSLYTDDFEIANPIGAHAKTHKVTIFYWQLLNIPPEFRSKLSSNQLLAVARQKDVKEFGLVNLLSNFKSGLIQLNEGLVMKVNGNDLKFKGRLAYVTGDTLAAQELGGFKEGVGSAYKFCRTCEITRPDISISFVHSDFPERSLEEHNDRCKALQICSAQTQKYWSKQYGINKESALHGIPGSQGAIVFYLGAFAKFDFSTDIV